MSHLIPSQQIGNSQAQENHCLWCSCQVPGHNRYCSNAHKHRAFRTRQRVKKGQAYQVQRKAEESVKHVHYCRWCGCQVLGRNWYCSKAHKQFAYWKRHLAKKDARQVHVHYCRWCGQPVKGRRLDCNESHKKKYQRLKKKAVIQATEQELMIS